MRTAALVLLAAGFWPMGQLEAGDVQHGAVRKEPVYKTKPKYCRILCGPADPIAVWAVIDDDVLYIDRHADGDLTNPSNRVAFPGGIVEIADRSGLHLTAWRGDSGGIICFEARYLNRYWQRAWVLAADRPQHAPTVRFGGPVQIDLDPNIPHRFVRGSQSNTLGLAIITPNPAPGTVGPYLDPEEALPPGAHAVADIEFPPRTRGAEPVRVRLTLPELTTTFKVPDTAGTGMAKVTISLAGWSDGAVASTSRQVPVVDPSPGVSSPATWKSADSLPGEVDLATIPRAIVREPTYRSPACYCLLLFGPRAETRVWLALDGDRLYADLNGDGDFTEPGKLFLAKDGAFRIGDVLERDGRTRHRNLRVTTRPSHLHPDRRMFDRISVEVNGRYNEFTVINRWTEVNRTLAGWRVAPIRHFNGPVRPRLCGSNDLVRGNPHAELRIVLATQYPTGEWVFISYNKGVPTDAQPMADVTFPAAAGAPPVQLTVPLAERC